MVLNPVRIHEPLAKNATTCTNKSPKKERPLEEEFPPPMPESAPMTSPAA